MKRLALLHTVMFAADLFKKMLPGRLPDLDCFHVVDESLLHDAMRDGGLTPGLVRRIVTHVGLARDAGAEAILFTCSSTSPAVDVARSMVDVPILKIDDPMAEKAVDLGSRIGVICTVSSTMGPSSDLLRDHAARRGKDVQVSAVLESAAFEAIRSGDREGHDRIVSEAVARLARENDVVVLAQASMAHLAPALNESQPVPVLASPGLCADALPEYLKD